MVLTIRAKTILLGVAALVLSLGISLPLEFLASRWLSERVARQEFIENATNLVPAIEVLWGDLRAGGLLQSVFARLQPGEQLYILDPAGEVLASAAGEKAARNWGDIPYPLPADISSLLAAQGAVSARTIPSRGGPITELFAHLSDGDTLFAVRSPQAILELQNVLFCRTIPLFLLGAGLMTGMFWFGLERILLKPLRLLAQSSQAVLYLENETTGIIPSELIPNDDLGEVLRARNLMLAGLRKSRLKLEEELHQRTFELQIAHYLFGRIGYHSAYQDLLQEVLVHLNRVVAWDVAAGFVVEAGQARIWAQSQVPVGAAARDEVRHWLEQVCLPAGIEYLQVLYGLWGSSEWRVGDPGSPVLERFGSHLALPLQAENAFVGVVVLGAIQGNAYSGHDARLIRDVLEKGLAAVGRVRRLVAAQTRGFESVLQSMNVGVLFLDIEGRLTYMNRRGEEYLARLEETVDDPGLHWREPSTLSTLFPLEGVEKTLEIRTRGCPEHSFRITTVPFTADSAEMPEGYLVVIEEPAARQ